MTHRQLKIGYFTLAAITSFATTYYFSYLFFYAQRQFHFGNLDNLLLSATSGFIYMCAAWYGGRFGQERGYFAALKLGFGLMAAAMASGWFFSHPIGQFASAIIWTLGMCFTWPNLEALMSEGESPDGLKQMVGVYNLVWAGGAAFAFFVGGALIENLGWQSIFWLPAGLHLAQLILTVRLERRFVALPALTQEAAVECSVSESFTPLAETTTRARARCFLRMAWLANPFAYIAINTAIPLIPGLARRFDLTPALAGVFCSAWMFARLGAFALLWRWTRWHYRFRWLLLAYLLLVLSFAALLLAPRLWAVVAAQVVFGGAVGLIYYSSLFYSMDASETKGVHGGMHESAIGFGIFAGPAVGAVAARFFPQQPNVSTWAVSGILLLGLTALCWLRQSNLQVSRQYLRNTKP